MQSQQEQIERYLRTVEYDDLFIAWPGDRLVEKMKRGGADLCRALVSEDCEAFARRKVAPMVQGLFPIAERKTILDMLGRSVVFLTPDTIEAVLNREPFLCQRTDARGRTAMCPGVH